MKRSELIAAQNRTFPSRGACSRAPSASRWTKRVQFRLQRLDAFKMDVRRFLNRRDCSWIELPWLNLAKVQ